MTERKIDKTMGEDLQKKYGALLSISDIVEYFGLGRTTVKRIITEAGCRSFGKGTGARFFYQDIIEAIMRR